MQIELLWIIPIVAFSFFIFLLVYFSQQKKDNPGKDLSREVSMYNDGLHQSTRFKKPIEERQSELEKAILLVTESIIAQRAQNTSKSDNNNANEIEDMKRKLRELYKELDIIVSENYSLRAKVKKLIQDKEHTEHSDSSGLNNSLTSKNSGKVNLKLYEDTRLLNVDALEDTSEFNDLAQGR